MRSRPASRLLILDPSGRVLLFRFVHTRGALAGQDYWATPGGAVEDGETFEQAALRELWEETGIVVDNPGPEIGCRTFVLHMPDGEPVLADERFFLIRPADVSLSRDGWTAQERDLMTEHRWWSCDELRTTTDIVWPKTIPEMIETVSAAEVQAGTEVSGPRQERAGNLPSAPFKNCSNEIGWRDTPGCFEG